MFPVTRWSMVRRAQDKEGAQSQRALSDLCQVYWSPLYSYIRRTGKSPHDAEDLTQAFFARLLEKDHLATAGQEKGKLRSFLLVMLKRFMCNEYERSQAAKRGGGREHISIDQELAEKRYQFEPPDEQTPEAIFDKHWALTLLDRVLETLRAEYEKAGRLETFEVLKDCLSWRSGENPYVDLAKQLDSTEGAIKAAVFRMRKRYRKILEEEIADTVAGQSEVDEELRHLMSVFQRG